MADRNPARALLTALGAGVLVGAGLLGVAYGLGVLRLPRTFTGSTLDEWHAQLTWVSWLAATAAVVGALVAARWGGARPGTTGGRLAVAGAAALGAAIVAPLCARPVRAAQVAAAAPLRSVVLCVAVGALAGLVAGLAALAVPVLRWNLLVTAAWVGLLVPVAVALSLGTGEAVPTVRLGVPVSGAADADPARLLAWLVMPGCALLTGAAVGALGRRRGQPLSLVGSSGAVGPALLALAYVAAGPGDAPDRYQATPYRAALIAVLAGALGATLAAVLRRPRSRRAESGTAIAPTEILPPLTRAEATPVPENAPTPETAAAPGTAPTSGATPPGTAAPSPVAPGATWPGTDPRRVTRHRSEAGGSPPRSGSRVQRPRQPERQRVPARRTTRDGTPSGRGGGCSGGGPPRPTRPRRTGPTPHHRCRSGTRTTSTGSRR